MALGDMLVALDKLHLTIPEDVHEDLMHVQGQLWRLDFEVSVWHAMSAPNHTLAAVSLTFHVQICLKLPGKQGGGSVAQDAAIQSA